MKNKLKILCANPAGNKTIFVLSSCERSNYTDTANKLFARLGNEVEQVGFILPPIGEFPERMEMCGQEFCGNASRSYGLYLAKLHGIEGVTTVPIRVSGIEEELVVEVDTQSNYTSISMPIPTEIKPFPLDFCPNAQLVLFPGIIHLVVFDQPTVIENFNRLKSLLQLSYDVPAIGVMFYDTYKKSLTPVVWVRDIDSTYFEGSCGSGSVATAAVLSSLFKDGSHSFILQQPKGTLEIIIVKENDIIQKAFLKGPVELGEPFDIFI